MKRLTLKLPRPKKIALAKGMGYKRPRLRSTSLKTMIRKMMRE